MLLARVLSRAGRVAVLGCAMAMLLGSSLHPAFVIAGGILAGTVWMGLGSRLNKEPLRLEKQTPPSSDAGSAIVYKYSDYYLADGI